MRALKQFSSVTLLIVLSFLLATSQSISARQFDTLPQSELVTFNQVFKEIKASYYKDVDDAELIRAAIKGMISTLDKHSQFMLPEDFERFTDENIGEYAGIGLQFNDHKFGIEIAQVIKNSPASRAGLEPGMIVTHVNKKPLNLMPREDAILELKGEANTQVELTVAAAKFPQPKQFVLDREVIHLESVSSQRLPNDTGYIAISQFTLNGVDEFKEAIYSLSEKSEIDNLILDLRNNPGGVMETALALSDLFIDEGKLLISSGRTKDSNQVYCANSGAPLSDLNVVIVINEGSASASEILTGALKDHQKAVVLGETSYGKGSIQTLMQLHNLSGMKITTAEYFSPLGNKIHDVGIIPDVKFSQLEQINPFNVDLLDDPQLLQAYNLVSSL